MENLEQKIKTLLASIPFRGGNVAEADIVKYFELDKDEAFLSVEITEPTQEECGELGKVLTQKLKTLDEINKVKVNFEKEEQPRTTAQPPPAASPKRTAYLQNYKSVVLVSSGKGGVGKSTVSLNLALALKQMGRTVSMMDADVFGPSLPLMTGLRGQRLKTVANEIMPLSKFGIEFVSVGNLISEGESVVWRGPMVHQALEQLVRDTAWPGGDYMIIDMPPGTGDVAISLAQITEAVGSVVVCTPQDVALIDARRALAMFDKVDIPVLGMVENMSGFLCPHCGKESEIFGKGGLRKDSENFRVPFLGSVPIDLKIRLGTDEGNPVMLQENSEALAACYLRIAENLETQISELS